MKLLPLILFVCLLITGDVRAQADWLQEQLFARDISVSHSGDRWVVTKEGGVSKWNAQTRNWDSVRTTQPFQRIDAGRDYVAAIADNGFVYLRKNSIKGSWQNTAIRASDVGIGGNQIWLAGVRAQSQNLGILQGTFTDNGLEWGQPLAGALVRLDVDPNGRAWASDAEGRLYVSDQGGWIQDQAAPLTADVGVGGNGALYIVEQGGTQSLGGGQIYERDAKTAKWSKVPGRLSSVSVTPNGRPVGVNALGWLIADQSVQTTAQKGLSSPKTGGAAKEKPSKPQDNNQTETDTGTASVLSDLVGELDIPPTIADAPIALIETDDENLRLASLKLNGLETYAVVIAHDGSDVPSLALTHISMLLTDYIPEGAETGMARLEQLNNPVFVFTHEENANKAFDTATFTKLKSYLGRDDLSEDGYDSGLFFHVTTNGNDFASVWTGGGVFDLGVEDIFLSGPVSANIFNQVVPSEFIPSSAAASISELIALYGDDIFSNGRLNAFIPALDGQRLGPLTIGKHNVSVGWGEELDGEVTFDLTINYVKPDLPGTSETLVLEGVRAGFNKNEKSAFFNVGLSPEKTDSIVDLAGFKHKETYFEGSFKLSENAQGVPDKLADFEELELTVSSILEKPTAASRQVSSTAKLSFVPDDDKEYLIPTLYVESGLTLADIVGTRVPGAAQIKLTNVEASTNYVAGDFEIAGAPARAVLYQPDGEDQPAIVSLQHQSVDLGGYIPPIRDSQIGSFGLANANLFFLWDENGRDVTFESFEDVPEELQSALQNGDYNGLFPLQIKKDVTVVGTYSPAEDGNAAAVMQAYGMDEKGYAVKGSFNFDQIKNARIRKFDPRFQIDKKAACERVTSADLGGLDLSFTVGDIKVPEVNGAIQAKDATFRLKGVDGQIEPSVMAKVFLNFPDNSVMGLKNLSSMGMFSVQGDLNVLCKGPSIDDDVKLAFVTSTEFNSTDLEDMSFASLDWVTGFGEPPAESADDQNAQDPNDTYGKPIEGWNDPLGIPYLKIRHYASSGTFEQKKSDDSADIKRTLTFQTWADARVDQAEVNIWGDVVYEIKADTLEVESWSLQIPDPIKLADLPGLDKLPIANELTIANIDLTNEEMVGQLSWQARGGVSATAYVKFDEEEGQPTKTLLMAEVNKIKPSWVTPFAPASILDTELAPALIGWSNHDTKSLAYDDAAEKLQPLLKSFIKEGESLTIANGLTLAGRTSMDKLLDNEGVSLLKEFATFEDQLVLRTALELSANDQLSGEFSANLDGFGLKNVPDGQLDFKNTELLLSNLDSNKIEIATQALTKLPNDSVLTSSGTLAIEKTTTKKTLSGSLTSDTKWPSPLGFDQFTIDNVGLQVKMETDGAQTKREIGVGGQGKFNNNSGLVTFSLASLDGKQEDKVITFEGNLVLSDLFSAPGIISNVADAQISKMIYSSTATAFDTVMTIGGYQYSGRGGILRDGDDHAMFLRQDTTLAFKDIITALPKPFDVMAIPKGLLIMGNKSVPNFKISGIPAQIYDGIFAGLWDEPIGNTLAVEDGLTFLTRMNVTELPGTFEDIITSDPFNVSGDFTVGGSVGGVYGGEKSLGFYLVLDKTRPKVPYVVKQVLEPARADAKLFVKSSGADNSFSVGMASKAILKSRRLDDPSVQVNLPTEFSIAYAQEANNPRPTVSLSAAIEGNWQDPFGLEGYALKDPSLTFGVSGEGVLVEVHTDEADFDGKKFVFDLATTWAGNVPTDLSVQFAKSVSMRELVLTPVDMFKLQKSIFDLAFKSGSALFKSIKARSYLNLVSQLEQLGSLASNGTLNMLEKSPLAMVGVRDPFIYFGTPGSTPPVREGVERPPFGLGLISQGELFLDFDGLEVDVAAGEYRVNLKDGYYVSGDVTPPAPFESSYFHLTGAQPLLSPGLGKLRLEGSLKLPGDLIPGVPAEIRGGFDFSRPGLASPIVNIAGDISIGSGTIQRSAELKLNGTSLYMKSLPNGCIDVPVKIEGTIDAQKPEDALKVLTLAKPHLSLPDPLSCPEALVKIWEKAIDVAKDPTQLANPLAAQQQMLDAAELALSALPDNEVTRTMYKGVAFANDATDAARDAAAQAMNKVPGAKEAQKALSDAQDKAKQAASAAINSALNATGPIGDIGRQGFDATKDIAMSGLNAMGDVFGDILGGFSSAWNSLSGGKNYCNARIEYMRRNGTAHETKAKVDQLWLRLNDVRIAALETEAVLDQWQATFNRIQKARQANALWYLSDHWNKFAQKMSRTDLYMAHLPSYHKQNVGWVDGRGEANQETYRLYVGFDTTPLHRQAIHYLYRAQYDKNLLDYVGIIKSFAEKSNFHPGADYPGFRCQKMQIVRMSFEAMRNMGITIRTDNTDWIGLPEFNGWWAQVETRKNQINALNQRHLQRMDLIQRLNIKRNVEYVSDIYLGMMDILNRYKTNENFLGTSNEDYEKAVENAQKAIDSFYEKALEVASLRGNADHWSDVVTRQKDAFVSLEQVLRFIYAQEIATAYNQDWSSKTRMPTIVLPYVKKCLHSFYRSEDRANPFYVRDCNEKMQQALDGIQSGKTISPRYLDQILKHVSVVAATGEVRVREDLRYQFRIWNAEQPDTVRLSTAVSETHPNVDYCLGVPESLSPVIGESAIRAVPCQTGDQSQLWTKVADGGGAAFFRLQSKLTGQCATWRGTNGVDALILKDCNEANKTHQVMTAGWPFRNATHAEPRLRELSGPKKYAFVSTQSARCITADRDNDAILAVAREKDRACNNVNHHRDVAERFKFTIEEVGSDHRRFVSGSGANRKCMVSNDTYVDEFSGEIEPDPAKGYRTVGLGSCEGEDSLWLIGTPGWDGWHEQRYTIREAFGKRQCLTRYISYYYRDSYKEPVKFLLQDCALQGLSKKRPDIKIRPEKQQFYPFEVR